MIRSTCSCFDYRYVPQRELAAAALSALFGHTKHVFSAYCCARMLPQLKGECTGTDSSAGSTLLHQEKGNVLLGAVTAAARVCAAKPAPTVSGSESH